MSGNPSNLAEQHLDWVRSIIAHRAPELSQDDIADAYGAPAEPEDGWAEIVPLIVDAIDALEAKLEALERIVSGEEDDDDVDEPGVRGQAPA